jgi:hypothetical protein
VAGGLAKLGKGHTVIDTQTAIQSDRVAAHEFGHVLGLHDRYKYEAKPHGTMRY